jgi:SAM-dependent methyltransferase
VSEPRNVPESNAASNSAATGSADEIDRIKSAYDHYADPGYADRWSAKHRGNVLIDEYRAKLLQRAFTKHGLLPFKDQRILDVGSGYGHVLKMFGEWGIDADHLIGIDLLEERVETAKQRHPGISFLHQNAADLKFEAGSFDAVCTFAMFSSILDDELAQRISSEITRVLRPGGFVIWYDFRFDNPRNAQVRGMKKSHISRLFPGFKQDLGLCTVLPPLVRRLGRLTDTAYPILHAIPVLKTHYIGTLQKP